MHRAITLLLVVVGLLTVYGVPGHAEATVSSLWTDQFCAGDGTVTVRLTWGPLDAHVIDQWLDLAWGDPFAQVGLRQTSQPFSAGTSSVDWRGLTPDLTYYARVTQRVAVNRASASPIFTFKTAACSSTQPGDIVSIGKLGATPSTSTAPSPPSSPSISTAPKPQGTPTPVHSENTPPVETTPMPETPQNCDRVSYPDVCLPVGPPYLTCSDIPDRNFRVRPPDPHRLDADGNGIGCEEVRRPIPGR
jgi:hypothetical protein